MQHNKGDFFKNDNKRPTATGPEQGERQGRQLRAERGEGLFGLRRVWGGGGETWDGSQGKSLRQPANRSGHLPRRARVAPASPMPEKPKGTISSCTTSPTILYSKAWTISPWRRTAQVSAEGRHGSSFSTQPTLRWSRQRDLARPSEVRGFPGVRRHGSLRAPRAFAAGVLVPHSIRKSWGKRGGFYF